MSRKHDFQDYLREYKKEIEQENYSTLERSKRFAKKLFGDYLRCESLDEMDEDNLYILDGCGDGGIDIAYLNQPTEKEEDTDEGDTWYIVQSKYGKSFQGARTLKDEAEKIFNTLQETETNLSQQTENFIERVKNFISKASEQDRLIYLFLTEHNPKKLAEQRALDDIRAMGQGRFGYIFDVEHYSVEKLFDEQLDFGDEDRFKINLNTNLIPAENGVFVGLSSLEDLYNFLKSYSRETGNLNILYDRNIRFFLSFRTKVNKKLKETLEKEPENFGLYNNGITIAVEEIKKNNEQFTLTNPKIVNGCQTTQAIHRVLKNKLDYGGTGTVSPELAEWKAKLQQGIVVVKIVEVKKNKDLLNNITRYTNNQNVVKEKDFIALESGLRDWQKDMEENYNIYLEIQAGGWEAQKSKRSEISSNDNVNVFELIKIYACGWLGKAGLAYKTNKPFAPPNGKIFEEIRELSEKGNFNGQDLYMAYCLKKMASEYKFGQSGRGEKKDSRRFTRYLFYMTVVEFAKTLMEEVEIEVTDNKNITQCLLELYSDKETGKKFFDVVVKLIDDYMNPKGKEDTIFCEPEFPKRGNEIRRFLMWDECGHSPCFQKQLQLYKKLIEMDGRIKTFINRLEVVKAK